MDLPSLAARTWVDLCFHIRLSLAFQILVQLATLALLGPLVAWAARRLVRLSGEPLVTNSDLAAFARSPEGAVLLLATALLTVAALLAEFAGQSWIAGHAIARQQLTLASTIAVVLRRWPDLILLGACILGRLLLLALPFVLGAFLAWYALLRSHDINYYLALRPAKWWGALTLMMLLGVAYAAVAIRQLARWIFSVPILVFENVAPLRALEESARRSHEWLASIVIALGSWWLLVLTVGILVAIVARPVEAAAMRWAGVDLSRVLVLTVLFAGLALTWTVLESGVLIAGHQSLVTRIYVEQPDAPPWRPPVSAEIDRQRFRVAWAAGLLVATLMGAGAAWFILSRPVPEPGVEITAHRGNPSVAPENTLAAFRAAVDAHAIYAELDVQRTRDGEVVVLHDRDLMRMAGDPRRIVDLTMADLAGIDVGLKYGAAFRGERVPSLAAVIDLVRGAIKLNVELKYNAPDPLLASAVVEVLRQKDFLDQAVITSLNAAALREIKAIEPRLRTGQIVAAAVGDVSRADANFLCLNSARTSSAVVRRAHAAGKEVHVWTVNRAEVVLRMIERGVDNIITDDPALAMQIVQKRRELAPAERLALRLRVLFTSPPPELVDPSAVTPI
jgi:glycerophosphoryl diester phosphodiesterase